MCLRDNLIWLTDPAVPCLYVRSWLIVVGIVVHRITYMPVSLVCFAPWLTYLAYGNKRGAAWIKDGG
jgi:hypothetical protein